MNRPTAVLMRGNPKITAYLLARLAFAALAIPAGAEEVSGVVLRLDGSPLRKGDVFLDVGRARFDLAPGFDRWLSLETQTCSTDDAGRFVFSGLPDGAAFTVTAKTDKGFGMATGAGPHRIRMAPLSGLRGKVVGKRILLKEFKVRVRSGGGLGETEGTLMKGGVFVLTGLLPGPAEIDILWGNLPVARQTAELKAGTMVGSPPFRVSCEVQKGPDPVVTCSQVFLVDSRGNPMKGLRLAWSTRWMDGAALSRADAGVDLEEKSAFFGKPPFVLRTSRLPTIDGVLRGRAAVAHGQVRRGGRRAVRTARGTGGGGLRESSQDHSPGHLIGGGGRFSHAGDRAMSFPGRVREQARLFAAVYGAGPGLRGPEDPRPFQQRVGAGSQPGRGKIGEIEP